MNLVSRKNCPHEMAEMIAARDALIAAGCAEQVTELFYDSNCDCCDVLSTIGADDHRLREIVQPHLSQFQIGGTVFHKTNCECHGCG